MNVPNVLTTIRLILVPVFLVIFFSDTPNAVFYALLVFLSAGITDVLDGYIARRYNLVTKWGSIVDPLADKLMSIAVLLSFTITGIIPVWILIVILFKEVIMVIGAAILFKKGTYVPAQPYGKAATILFYVAIVSLEFFQKPLSLIPIYMTVVSALYALYKYFENFKKLHGKELEMEKVKRAE